MPSSLLKCVWVKRTLRLEFNAISRELLNLLSVPTHQVLLNAFKGNFSPNRIGSINLLDSLVTIWILLVIGSDRVMSPVPNLR